MKLAYFNYAEMVNNRYPFCRPLSWKDIQRYIDGIGTITSKLVAKVVWSSLHKYVYKPTWSMYSVWTLFSDFDYTLTTLCLHFDYTLTLTTL